MPARTSRYNRLSSWREKYAEPPPTDWPAAVEEHLGVPVLVTSDGPTAADKTLRHPLPRHAPAPAPAPAPASSPALR